MIYTFINLKQVGYRVCMTHLKFKSQPSDEPQKEPEAPLSEIWRIWWMADGLNLVPCQKCCSVREVLWCILKV